MRWTARLVLLAVVFMGLMTQLVLVDAQKPAKDTPAAALSGSQGASASSSPSTTWRQSLYKRQMASAKRAYLLRRAAIRRERYFRKLAEIRNRRKLLLLARHLVAVRRVQHQQALQARKQSLKALIQYRRVVVLASLYQQKDPQRAAVYSAKALNLDKSEKTQKDLAKRFHDLELKNRRKIAREASNKERLRKRSKLRDRRFLSLLRKLQKDHLEQIQQIRNTFQVSEETSKSEEANKQEAFKEHLAIAEKHKEKEAMLKEQMDKDRLDRSNEAREKKAAAAEQSLANQLKANEALAKKSLSDTRREIEREEDGKATEKAAVDREFNERKKKRAESLRPRFSTLKEAQDVEKRNEEREAAAKADMVRVRQLISDAQLALTEANNQRETAAKDANAAQQALNNAKEQHQKDELQQRYNTALQTAATMKQRTEGLQVRIRELQAQLGQVSAQADQAQRETEFENKQIVTLKKKYDREQAKLRTQEAQDEADRQKRFTLLDSEKQKMQDVVTRVEKKEREENQRLLVEAGQKRAKAAEEKEKQQALRSSGADAQIDKFVDKVLEETGVRQSVDLAKAAADTETGFDNRAGYPRDPRAPSNNGAKVQTRSKSRVVVGNENGVNVGKESCTDCDVKRAPKQEDSTRFTAKMGGRNVCFKPLEKGDCDKIVTRFGYDPVSGSCRQFDYGGCNGNGNNFATQAACEEACRLEGREVDRMTIPVFKHKV